MTCRPRLLTGSEGRATPGDLGDFVHDRETMTPLGRRRLLAGLCGLTASLATPALAAPLTASRALAFHSLHTGETVRAAYWADGGPDLNGVAALNHVMRDWRSGEATAMDPALFDLLHDLHRAVGGTQAFHIISAYRSPKTNAKLAAKSNGVAKRSLHMQGRAIDVALPGVKLRTLRDAAWALQRGGVGTYSKSGFIHVDTGRVRRWGA